MSYNKQKKIIIREKGGLIIQLLSGTALAAYLSLLLYLTFLSPHFGRNGFHRGINIVPFKSIAETVAGLGVQSIIIDLLGNIAAFLPLGFLLPRVFPSMGRVKRILIVAFITSLSIEIVQYISGVGFSDIDDVLLNITGGVLGYRFHFCFFALIRNRLRRNTRVKDTNK
ncbi:MAG: VanZ family protein [Bacillota bacterium]|nr:VanZ family protein [Bacillota bacterium]